MTMYPTKGHNVQTTNNRWAAAAGAAQWLVAVWCVQYAFNTDNLELLAPGVISWLSGCITFLGFCKHEVMNDMVEEAQCKM